MKIKSEFHVILLCFLLSFYNTQLSAQYDIFITGESCEGQPHDGVIAVVSTGSCVDCLVELSNQGSVVASGMITAVGDPVLLSNLATGSTYMLRIDCANSLCDTIFPNPFVVPLLSNGFLLTPIVINDVTCNGGTDGAIAGLHSGKAPPFTFLWNNGRSDSIITDLAVGTYMLTVSDANGCSKTSSVDVGQPAPLTASIGNIQAISCPNDNNGQAEVLNPSGGNGGYTYLWASGETTQLASMLGGGDQSVTVTDREGCSRVLSFSVSTPAAIDDGKEIISVSCKDDNDGAIFLNPSGGNGSFSYLWSNGSTTKDVQGLSPGNYSVTLTDEKQCSSIFSYVITEPDSLTATGVVQQNISCDGTSLGIASVLVQGGTPSYTYEWSNGSDRSTISNLDVGTYTLTIMDENDCMAETSVTIIQEINPQFSSFPNQPRGLDGESTSLAFASDARNVIFYWEIVGVNNVDSTNLLFSGNTPDRFSQTYLLIDQRSFGTIQFLVYPQSDDCIGDSIFIDLIIIPDENIPFFPDLITPNGDGDNDEWQVQFPPEKDPADYSLVIYNRVGAKVFENNSMTDPWRGNNCADGVYYYQVKSNNSSETYKGAVSIIRRLE